MLLLVTNETLNYASLVFLPELVSLGFLTGAYITELYVLMLTHHRLSSHVRKIGQERYKKELQIKRYIFIGYSSLIIMAYIALMISSIKFNTEETDTPDQK